MGREEERRRTGAAKSGRLERPQLFIFDLDGTLIDSREDLATAVNLMRGSYGLPPLPTVAVVGYVGDGIRKLVARATEGAGVDLDEAVLRQKDFYRLHLTDRTVLYPGVEDGLRALRAAGHTLAVATNKPVDATELILRHFGIRELFSAVLGGGGAERLKPHPEMILRILRETAFPPERCWMVGDHHTDLRTAREAGVRGVFIEGGIGVRGNETPDIAFASFMDFTAAFLAP